MLVDRLLQGPDYAKNWASIWTVWLMTRSGPDMYHEEMRSWLESQFAKPDQGFDKTVTELLTATGKNTENGAVNFIQCISASPFRPTNEPKKASFPWCRSRRGRLGCS